MENLSSKTISYLRLPLMILVVTIHTNLYQFMNGEWLVKKGDYLGYDFFNYIVVEEIARIAVPLFFVISGYLFFYGKDFDLHVYSYKIKKRIYSLLIPYLIWNILVGIFQYVSQKYLSGITSGARNFIVEYKWYDWFRIFWNYTDGTPICNQFWFIRDLMILVILSPIVYWFIKYTKIYGIIILNILVILGIFPKLSFYTLEPYFFFIGAYFAINKIDIVSFSRRHINYTLLYPILLILSLLVEYHYIQLNIDNYFHKLSIYFGILLAFSIVSKLLESEYISCNKKWTECTFFLYAYHMLTVSLLCKLCIKYIRPDSSYKLIISFIIIDFIIVLGGYYLYHLFKRYMPRITSIMCGSR